MANFTKAVAQNMIKGGTANKIELEDKTLGKFLTYIVAGSFISAYGSGLTSIDASTSGSVTVYKDVAGAGAKKTGLGIDTTAIAAGKITSVTLYANYTYQIAAGFSVQDRKKGLAMVMPAKMVKVRDQLSKFREREGFKGLGAKFAQAGTTAFPTVSAAKKLSAMSDAEVTTFWKACITKAHELTRLKDDAQAIDLISKDDMFIDLDPILFQRLVDLKAFSDGKREYFEGGIFTVTTIAGFKVRAVPFIDPTTVQTNDSKEIYGFISTNFSGKSFMTMDTAIAEKYPVSNDMAYNFEASYTSDEDGDLIGFGSVYDKVTIALTE